MDEPLIKQWAVLPLRAIWQTLTFVPACARINWQRPGFFDQAMNGETFKEYLRSQLGPTLKPSDRGICENLRVHKVTEIKELIEARSAKIKYLPPYSPNLNPIEHVFAKLKALFRKVVERNADKLWQAIGQIMDQFHSDECLNVFNNSGYVSN